MVTKQFRISFAAALAISAIALAGCASGESAPSEPPVASSSAPDASDKGTGPGNGCSVHLFDDDNFDETDDNFILSEAGKYENLSNLPGASKDWTDEADSIRVGADATVTVWSDPLFQGQSTTFEPGSEHPDLDSEPSSLEMSC